MRRSRGPTAQVVLEPLESRALLSGALAGMANSSLAIDAAGTVHVAYYDASGTGLKYATRSADGSWSAPVLVDGVGGAGSQLSIALNASGTPGIAYYDAGKRDLRYATLGQHGWSVAVVDAKGVAGLNPSLAYDNTNHPLISYYAAGAKDLRLAAFDHNRWKVSTVDASGSVGRFSSIAISPVDGSWAIAYERADTRQIKLAWRKKNKTIITTLDTLAPAANWQSAPSLSFDATGRPAVTYADPASGAVVFTQATASGWSKSTVVSSAAATSAALTFDPQTQTPRIVYADRIGGVGLAARQDTGWSTSWIGSGASVASSANPLGRGLVFLSEGDSASIDPALIAPTHLSASAAPGEVDLAWADTDTNARGFSIQRATPGGAFATVAQTSANVTHYTDTSTADDTSYIYRVRALDAAGGSGFSTPVTVSTAAANATPRSTTAPSPTSPSSNGGATDTVPSTPPAGQTQQSPSSDANSTQNSVPPDQSSTPAPSSTAPASDPPAAQVPLTAPATPTGLSATYNSDTQITLTWQPQTGVDGYDVYVSGAGGSYKLTGSAAGTAGSYVATGLRAGIAFSFRLSATNQAGSSQPAQTTPVPAAPVNLHAAAATSTPRVTLTWTASAGATTYRIERSADGSTWTTRSSGFIGTSFVDDATAAGTTYTYRVTALNPGGASLASNVGIKTTSFVVLDAMATVGKPDLSATGIRGVVLGYEWGYEGSPFNILTDDKSSAIEANVRNLADYAAARGQPLVLDVESWQLDIRGAAKADVARNLGRLIQMVGWAHDQQPGLKVSVYGLPGITGDWNPIPSLQKAGDFWRGVDDDTGTYDASHDLISHLDFLCPCVYAVQWNVAGWAAAEQIAVGEAHRLASAGPGAPKPVYAFMWMRYGDTGSEMPSNIWLQQLQAVRSNADGMILWDGSSSTWSASDPWWTLTQSFLAQPGDAPPAPDALSIGGPGLRLTWTDHSGGTASTLIERSSDGVNFSDIATLAPGQTTWMDENVQGNASYVYRVRTSDGVTVSTASNAVRVTGTRDAHAQLAANSYDAAAEDVRTAFLACGVGGNWVEYGAMDFGAGATTLSLSLVADTDSAGQQVRVVLDSLGGPVIGMLSVTPTGGWGTWGTETAALASVSGVHNVYLVFSGPGVDGIGTLQFT